MHRAALHHHLKVLLQLWFLSGFCPSEGKKKSHEFKSKRQKKQSSCLQCVQKLPLSKAAACAGCEAPLTGPVWPCSRQASALNETLFWAASAECPASFTPLQLERLQLVEARLQGGCSLRGGELQDTSTSTSGLVRSPRPQTSNF